MAGELTTTEKQLGRQLAALRSTQDRPSIIGGGMIGDAINFLSARVPIMVIRASVLVFIAYHAWTYYARAQQMVSELAATSAEAIRAETEAQAVNQQLGMTTAQREAKLAELAQMEADAAKATAQAQALNSQMDGQSARLKGLKADLAKATGDRDKAQVLLKAQQNVNERGITIARAQKQAELAKLESEVQKVLAEVQMQMTMYYKYFIAPRWR